MSVETLEGLSRIIGLPFDWIGQIYEVKGNTDLVPHLIVSKPQKAVMEFLLNAVKIYSNLERTKEFN